MRFDPFAQCLPRSRLVGFVVVALEEVNFQVWRLSQTRYLVSTLRNRAGDITRRLSLVGIVLRRDKSNAERLN